MLMLKERTVKKVPTSSSKSRAKKRPASAKMLPLRSQLQLRAWLHRPYVPIGVLLVVLIGYVAITAHGAAAPPPAGGYFQLVPAGQFSSLPSDAQAATMVHRSSWEPRAENATANHTVPDASFKTLGYSGMENHDVLFGRVTGAFAGTTDEIIQWAAAKWGLPDDVMRAEAVSESSWYQNQKDASGKPVPNHGYGDYGNCGGSPAPSGYGASGPASFGIMQIKWCAHKDASAPGYDGWPWSETSTAYNLDYYGAVIRGCVEGWDSWLGNGYQAGDMWGCIGRWYAGEWYSTGANDYINSVKSNLSAKPWRNWVDQGTSTPTPTPTATATPTPTPTPVVTPTPTPTATPAPTSTPAQTSTPTPTPTPTPTATPAPASGTGLKATYYDTKNLDWWAPQITRTDPTVGFDWGYGSPDSHLAPDTFSARWTGFVQAPTTGTYRFYTQSDDGVRLWVNGQQLVNNWTLHSTAENSGTISLVAGQKYSIKIEYFENTGRAVARLLWSGPGLTKVVVPQARLYPN
jgi:cell division septation protein DedD